MHLSHLTHFSRRLVLVATLACGMHGTAQAQANTAAASRPKASPPPSAQLDYAITASQSGLSIGGNARVSWENSAGRYRANTEVRAALIGKILEENSEGAIDANGLVPDSYMQKRQRKDPSTATFNRQTRVISFAGAEQTYPIKGGEQDRGSAIWQLVSLARAAPAKFKTGTSWTFFVAGQRDGEPWTFKVDKQEKIRTAQGETVAMHVVKSPPPDSQQQKIDLWLAPAMEWYPVKLRYTEGNGDFIEQTLEGVSKK